MLDAVRGRAGIPAAIREPNVILAAKGAHSAKPAAAYDLIERVIPGASRLELFARQPRPGWTTWGNQADGSAISTPARPVVPEADLFGGVA
jgi:N6-adenosine-specific RNA methylase IME4